MAASAAASIRFSVSGVSGQVRATMSASPSSWRKRSWPKTASAPAAPVAGSRLVAITRMSKALASRASRPPMRPMPTISIVLPVSWSSRAAICEIIPRQRLALWLSRASGRRRAERQDQRHGVLGHGLRVDASGAGEPDCPLAQQCFVVVVGAGADRLDEPELARAAGKLVLPQHGDDQHVGLRQVLAPDPRRSAPRHGRCRCRAKRTAQPCGRRRGQSRW